LSFGYVVGFQAFKKFRSVEADATNEFLGFLFENIAINAQLSLYGSTEGAIGYAQKD